MTVQINRCYPYNDENHISRARLKSRKPPWLTGNTLMNSDFSATGCME